MLIFSPVITTILATIIAIIINIWVDKLPKTS